MNSPRSVITCPICGTPFDAEATEAMPFCGHRCRQIDLGRWFAEEYSLPIEPDEDGEEVSSPA